MKRDRAPNLCRAVEGRSQCVTDIWRTTRALRLDGGSYTDPAPAMRL